MKVVTFVGTRPELIKLSRVIAELDRSVDHILVHSGQNYDYELNQIFFEQLEIRKPDVVLDAAGGSAIQTIAQVLVRGEEILRQHAPDAVLVLGDTNSCLVVLAAKRQRIPIFHMEAGNRCFDERVPEEINRRMVDHISDINLTYTEHARRYLLREGIAPETVIKTGSPLKEVLTHYRPKIEAADIVARLGLQSRGYFVMSAHREENVDIPERLALLMTTANSIAESYEHPVIFTMHPRTRKRLDAAPEIRVHPQVRIIAPLGFIDFIKLQMESYCVLSDSGTITEESGLLGFPGITIRQAHERPEGMDEGTVVMCDLAPERIAAAIEVVGRHAWGEGSRFRVPPDYDADLVSKKVVRIIMSYTDYVRRTVWFERGLSG
jgi:UDP-N-acetylglucosamine 2-epimerase (non-hydrolysing)